MIERQQAKKESLRLTYVVHWGFFKRSLACDTYATLTSMSACTFSLLILLTFSFR
jgi:hypothetical protein